jgi:aminoglycoside phosphotransferase family enzyme/predicted kinase
MDGALPPLISALRHPALYPGCEAPVELLQTHGAWVLLAGASAFKIKKPVKFDFMDFSTLALRRAACEAEIRVNRRWASDDPARQIYREVLPIVGTPEAPRWGRPGVDDDHAIEFAVHMHRFDEAGRLDHRCAQGQLLPAHLVQLAQRLAHLQALAPAAPPDSPWGQPQTVHHVVQDNLRTLQQLHNASEDRPTLQALQDWTDRCWPAVSVQLAQRRAAGRVREGHGDLHLANLVLLGDEVVPFDAIEFNEALRWVDVAGDLAFTWMDLQRMGQPGLAHRLLSEWLDASGDVSAPAVLPFFAVYLALVRAKVAAIRRAQLPPGEAAEQAACQAEVQQYLRLAQQLACPQPPCLLITHGLSGSGKSRAATQWLLHHAGSRALRLRSDVERKRLHGLAPLQASDPAQRTRFYGPQASALTYGSLQQRAEALLQAGWSVVVDAAFLKRHERDAFAALARAQGCAFGILAPQAPLEVLRQRITHRQARGRDPSEATLDVLEQQLQSIEPLGDDEPRLPLE